MPLLEEAPEPAVDTKGIRIGRLIHDDYRHACIDVNRSGIRGFSGLLRMVGRGSKPILLETQGFSEMLRLLRFQRDQV